MKLSKLLHAFGCLCALGGFAFIFYNHHINDNYVWTASKLFGAMLPTAFAYVIFMTGNIAESAEQTAEG